VIKKTFWLVLLFLIGREGKTQGLTYSIDSLNLKVSRTVQLEDGTTDTVSCSRYHHFIWFNEANEIAKKINRFLYSDLSDQDIQSVAELQQIFKNDFSTWKEEWMAQFSAEDTAPIDFSYNLNWYEELYTGELHRTANTLTIISSTDGYYGGAHPLSGSRYIVFNLQNGEPIEKWQNLVTDTLAILKIAESIFRKEKGLGPHASLAEAGYWFNNEKFHLTDNFGFDQDGLFFFFNVYEITAYAAGPIDITIPYAQLKRYLKKPL
jgi:hypothetical protein